MRAFDLHCDTLLRLKKDGDLTKTGGMVSLDGLLQGEVGLQCFAVFVATGLFPSFCRDALSAARFDQLYRKYQAMMERHKSRLYPVLSASDLDRAAEAGKTGVLLTIEDGGVLGHDLANVEAYYRKGVRLVTLTWNHANAIGFPNSPDPSLMSRGLTDFGREVVREMERLGMVADVSHVSDGVFWDVAEMAQKPFVASHSNSRALCSHPRNMTDDMIRILADKGGVMGLNLAPDFLAEDTRDSRVEDMVRHILHIRNVGGSEVLALGSDFDGIGGNLEVSGPQDWPKLYTELHQAGLPETELEQMWWRNADRVLRAVLH